MHNDQIVIRPVTPDDAEAMVAMYQAIDAETDMLLLEPDERNLDVERQRERLTNMPDTDRAIFVADNGVALIGYLSLRRERWQRSRHCAYVVVALRQSHTRRGIGGRLFDTAEAWARENGLHRLELTVRVDNAAAVRLYLSHGFIVEGTRRHSLRIDNRYVDEYYMSKLLD
jgi:RimJ/RimL family protein N-acetyltransferase